MKNQVVRLRDPGLLSFMFPDFVVRETLSLMDRGAKIIYVGRDRRDLREYLSGITSEFIATVGRPDLDLSGNLLLAQWAAEYRGKKLSKKLESAIDMMDDSTFDTLFKIFWVTGKWGNVEDSDGSIFALFKAASETPHDFIRTGLMLMESTPAPVLESGLLTFLGKVVHQEKVSPAYSRVIRAASAKLGDKIRPAVTQYSGRTGMGEQLRFLSLLLSLR